ncbi:glycosyltransferase, partial [Salmonella enterica]|nr:glycosyltransferase [Salmonella enterica]
ERYTILIISRLDDFKIHGIVKLLDDIIQYTKKNKSCKISVHIVGDGIAGKFLKENYVNSINMDVFFHGYVSGKKLTELFHNGNYSLLFAMGTSALEGASRGLPTVLLPCTDKSIRNRDNVYRYLHIDNDQGLGEYIDTPFEGTEYLTFNEIVEIFNRDKENLVCNTRKYFLNNYGKEITQKKFLLSLEKVKILSINEVKISLTFRIYTKFILKKRLSTGV